MSKSFTQNFYSIGQRYFGDEVPMDLQLRLSCYSDDAIEIVLINQRYHEQRSSKLRQLLAVLCLYSGYCALRTFNTSPLLQRRFLDVGLIVWLLHILLSTLNLIKSEKLLFCVHFALQLQTERMWCRHTNVFIPTENIHDIAINEVIENLDIRYLLIVRTKGCLFKRKPILTIFNSLHPSIDCLEVVYKHLRNTMHGSALSPTTNFS